MLNRVLMVDDDPTVLQFAGKRFEKLGFKVMRARNGDEARTQVRNVHFDFAIVDVRMDAEDGVAIAAGLQQEECRDLPVAILTAFDTAAARTEAAQKRLQPFDWYRKPLPAGEAEFAKLGHSMLAKAVADRFRLLTTRWHVETKYVSSINEACTHPAYQAVVGMGQAAVPLIIASLRREPDWWFWALKAITGDDPVFPDARGDLHAMTAAWLDWAAFYEIPEVKS